jgi:hypothetical protein
MTSKRIEAEWARLQNTVNAIRQRRDPIKACRPIVLTNGALI